MEFLNPNMLWGLLGLSVPVAIHLLQLKRYKTIQFSDIRFLKAVQRSARKQQKIRHWLILAARMLFWGALSLAFALPFLPNEESPDQQSSTSVVYVDLSPSMMRQSADGPLWVSALESARALLNTLPAEHSVHLVTPELDGSDARALSREAALAKLDKLGPTETSVTLNDIQERTSTYGLNDTVTIYTFTDGQTADIAALKKGALPIRWQLMVLQGAGEAENTTVDSVWLERPVLRSRQNIEVSYRIKRYGRAVTGVPVELWVNGHLRGAATIDLENNGTTDGSFSFRSPKDGVIQISVRVNDPAMTFDNHYELVIESRKGLRILHITDDELKLPLNRVFRDSAVTVEERSYGRIPYTSLDQWDLVVLDSTGRWPDGLLTPLRQAVENGTSVLIVPTGMTQEQAAGLGVGHYGSGDTSTRGSLHIRYSDPFFTGVFYKEQEQIDLPRTKRTHPLSAGSVRLGAQLLLSYSDGSPSLVRYAVESGQIYQWDAHPGRSEWHRHPLLAPLLYQMAIYRSRPQWISIPLEASIYLPVPGVSERALVIQQDSVRVIPEQYHTTNETRVNTRHPELRSGFAAVLREDDTVAVWAYHTHGSESQMSFESASDIEAHFRNAGISGRVLEADGAESATRQIAGLSGIKSIAPWWILLAILCILLEMFLWSRPKG